MLVMLIENLNRNGGLLGRPVEAVIMDPRSDAGRLCARRPARCWPITPSPRSSAAGPRRRGSRCCRCWRSYDGLLFYPSQYEGEEQSPHVIYTGATPQQQAIPAVDHLLELGRRRFVLVGTDYVYPRTTNAIIRNYLATPRRRRRCRRSSCTRRSAKRTGTTACTHPPLRRRATAPSSPRCRGDSNVHFFRERARQGLDADILPVMSLSLGEAEMPALAERNLIGHMVAWTYLHTLDTPENQAFIAAWRQFCDDPAATTNDADGSDLDRLPALGAGGERRRHAPTSARSARRLAGRTLRAPSGFDVVLDAETQHLHKPGIIGRMDARTTILPVWISDGLIAPEPWSRWLPKDTLKLAG